MSHSLLLPPPSCLPTTPDRLRRRAAPLVPIVMRGPPPPPHPRGQSQSGAPATHPPRQPTHSQGGTTKAEATRSRGEPLALAPGEIRVGFQNSAHERLAGIFRDAKSQNGVVILCHGYASSKNGFHLPAIAAELAKKRISSLRFDFSGNGDSQGVFDFGNYWKEVQDLRCAVNYVRDVMHKKVLAILGHSKGGNVVLLYAGQYDDVPVVVNVAGRYVMGRGIKERFGEDVLAKVEKMGQVEQSVVNDTGDRVKFMLTKRALEERTKLDMEAAVKKISLSEVLTVHGTGDMTIPPEDAQLYAKVIRQHTLALVEGADHNFRQPLHTEAMLRRVVDFICQEL